MNNSWAVILGASGALGYASVEKLAAEGWNLVLIYRERRANAKEFEQKVSALRTQGIELILFNQDALDESAINEIILELAKSEFKPRIGLLLHAIAKGNLKPLTGENAANKTDFELTLYAMAYNLVDWVNALLKASLFAEHASVIGLDSEGSQRSIPNYAVVGAAKSVLIKLVEEMAIELAPQGIRCNILRPGVVDTTALRMIPHADQIIENASKRNPSGRITKPEDVANAVYLLSMKESRWITGSIIKVDGGESLG